MEEKVKDCEHCPLKIREKEAPICDNCIYKKIALRQDED